MPICNRRRMYAVLQSRARRHAHRTDLVRHTAVSEHIRSHRRRVVERGQAVQHRSPMPREDTATPGVFAVGAIDQ
jgi:hypothetical protein